MKVGILNSGGKDSAYSSWWAQMQGWEVVALITIKIEEDDSMMFQLQGTHISALQSISMNIPWLPVKSNGVEELEINDLKQALEGKNNNEKIFEEIWPKEISRPRNLQIIDGAFLVNSRMVLKATLLNNGSEKTFFALNDFVVDRGKSQRIIGLELYAGNHFISSYKSDGLIISTPTGSTAYSLSAGGPILAPGLSAITITPLSPHTLSLRPIVLSDNQILKIKSLDKGEIAFAVDGQVSDYFSNDTFVKIEKAPYDIKMIGFEDSDYFKTLNLKLGWGRRGKD